MGLYCFFVRISTMFKINSVYVHTLNTFASSDDDDDDNEDDDGEKVRAERTFK